jgi:phosphatidylglycerophosphate synthase
VIPLLKAVNKAEIRLKYGHPPGGRTEAVLSGSMRTRMIVTAASALLLSLLLAAPALAKEGGEGLYGKTNDKVITNFGFGLMIFFTLLVTILSIGQYLLERRKQSK